MKGMGRYRRNCVIWPGDPKWLRINRKRWEKCDFRGSELYRNNIGIPSDRLIVIWVVNWARGYGGLVDNGE